MNVNLAAFLTTIAQSEGTEHIGTQHGYNVLCGGGIFLSYKDHPRQLIDLPRLHIKSTAAGRYQILAKYYDAYKIQLRLSDFSPASQDKIAIQLIKECKALDDIEAGRFSIAVGKCKSRWASLPGAGYGQHENTLAVLEKAYTSAGGVVST
jgi:muramidase (phage lysozyme)